MKITNFCKIVLTVLMMVAVSTNADAQLGGLLNKAKKTVKDAGKTATNTATQAASSTVYDLSNNNPRPWTMDISDNYDFSRKIQAYVQRLNEVPQDSVKALKQMMLNRYNRNKEIIEKYKDNQLQMDFKTQTQYDNLKKENDTFEDFFMLLGRNHATILTMDGEVDIANNKASISQCQVSGALTTFFLSGENPCFITMSGDKTYIEGDDLAEVRKNMVQLYNIFLLCDGIDNIEAQTTKVKAYMCLDTIGRAVENNKPENLERRPMPKGGPLNASLSAKALAAAKERQSYANVTKAVITTDWRVERNALGEIIRRKCDGYVFYNDKFGLRANGIQWAEDYVGGGKYGPIKVYGTGMQSFYVQQ